MKTEQITKALRQKFDDQRLVFWHDADGEFAAYLQDGLPSELSEVQVVYVHERGGLPTKLLLEREDVTGKYLLYRTGPQLPPEQDWLLDVRLYSDEFHADMASLWLEELGLSTLSLRDHLRARARFLANQQRRIKLRRLLTPSDDEDTLDRKMMAVVCGSPLADFFSILRALCHSHLSAVAGDDASFDDAPKILETLATMGLAEYFWAQVEVSFNYASPSPSLAGLLRRLFVSELMQDLVPEKKISAISHLELPARGLANALVFLTQWRDSSQAAVSYDTAAAAVARDLEAGEHLRELGLAQLSPLFTFWEVELRVVSQLKARVLADGEAIDLDFVQTLAHQRQAGHWLAGSGRDRPERAAVARAYNAIVAAAQLFALKRELSLTFDGPQDLLQRYQRELYRFDQCYRHFHVNARPAEAQGWDLLKALGDRVEDVYDGGFLGPLGLAWSQILDGSDTKSGFLKSWRLDVHNDLFGQQRFFEKLKTWAGLDKDSRRRAYVIISDAFRYEAAVELADVLNGQTGVQAKLSGLLGVLPSYTTLGMASLLPHQTLDYAAGLPDSAKGHKPGSADVLVDGRSVASTQARNKQLSSVDGMACQAEDLRGLKRDEAKELVGDRRVVYIYHNVIDARGDSASTESETFEAVGQCIEELASLVKFCFNRLDASRVWVTADHGFLYQRAAPDQTDRSVLSHRPSAAIKVKKRYVIGPNLATTPEAHLGNTRITAGTSTDMGFWIPRGSNRFYFTGGARFVHGGAMPQEILVPVVEASQLRGAKRVASRVEKVGVQVLGARHKITAPRHRFELLQTEAVGGRRKPISLRVAVYDGAKPVTSVETVTFDSSSDSMEDRRQRVLLTLAAGTYDKRTEYRLVLRDADTDAEVQSISVVIDRSFADDF